MQLLSYAFKRIFGTIPLILVITIITFLLIRLAPGDPTKMFINPNTRPEDRVRIRHNLGLDRPIPIQYLIWLKNLVTKGDMGYSLVNGRSVSQSIIERIPATLLLMGVSWLISILLAIPIGIYSAMRPYSFGDYLLTIFSFAGLSMPGFWLALMAIWFFSLKLQLLPPMGISSVIEGSFALKFQDTVSHMILPVSVLTVRNLAVWSRYVRSSLIETLGEDYIRTAYAKGFSEFLVLYRHALRNAMLPLITLTALSAPEILAGAFIIEQIFAWPGMGRLGMEAVFHRDYTLLMGDIFISSLLVVFANILADLSYTIVDPRIRLVSSSK